MDAVTLTVALAAVLLTPGPTNTLVALAGAERGWLRAQAVIPAEVAAYLLVTIPLAYAGSALMVAFPQVSAVLSALAAAWVAWLAFGMFRAPGDTAVHTVTAARVFVTTLMNPKALLVGLAILPASGAPGQAAALFAVLICLAASAWAAFGALAGAKAGGRTGQLILRRIAGVWLAALSAALALRAASA